MEEALRRHRSACEELVSGADCVEEVLQQQLRSLQTFQQQTLRDANLVQLKIKSILNESLQEHEGWNFNCTPKLDYAKQSTDYDIEQDVCRACCVGPLDPAACSLKSHETLCCLGYTCTDRDEEKKCIKYQILNENKHIQQEMKALQCAVTTDLKAVNILHVLNVRDTERSVYHTEEMVIHVLPFSKENLLCTNRVAQLWVETRNILVENAQYIEEIKTLKKEKNLIQLQLTRAEEDSEYYVMELKTIIGKCEEFLLQKKFIEDQRNFLWAERYFMMKRLRDREIERAHMAKALAAGVREKEEIMERLKSTRRELLSQVEQKQQLQLKLGRTMIENILLKEQQALSQTQRTRAMLISGLDDKKEICLDLASFESNRLALVSVAEKSLKITRCSFNDQYKSDDVSKEHVRREIQDLKAKNLMLWFRFCDHEQEYHLVIRLVQCLKKENNMLCVELEGHVLPNTQLQRRITKLKDKTSLMERYMTTVENQLETFKHNLRKMWESYHLWSQGIGTRKDTGMLQDETLKRGATYSPAKDRHITVLSPEPACHVCTGGDVDTPPILNDVSNVTISLSVSNCGYRDKMSE